MLFARLLHKVVQEGQLTVIGADGSARRFGDGTGPAIVIRLHQSRLHNHLFFNPELHVGEAYMDGDLTVEEGSLYDFVDLIMSNLAMVKAPWAMRLYQGFDHAFRVFQQYNPAARARANAAHHYDLSGKLYDLFLDADRQYSCAYFTSASDSLEVAQANKKRHIAAKLALRPGLKVLDIGSGWGGLSLFLAREANAEVTGITLSSEQEAESNRRAREAGMANQVRFHLRDYREQTGTFDRIVSVGMFEHVGVAHFDEYFGKIREMLTEDGIALLHSIGRSDGPGFTNPWIRKYIFPGGYSPALSEVTAAVERSGLFMTDIEILRLHYAETLREWRRRFAARRNEARKLYDERFCRMWELYLTGSELAFRRQGHMVFQMQLARRQDAAPLTRDYIVDWERTQTSAANLAA